MSAQNPVLPVAVGTLVRGVAEVLRPVLRLLKSMERAMRHRREANVLAHLDRHMLADIGITRSDLRDAFSAPLWADPTELLNERVNERRRQRPVSRLRIASASEDTLPPQPAHRRALPML